MRGEHILAAMEFIDFRLVESAECIQRPNKKKLFTLKIAAVAAAFVLAVGGMAAGDVIFNSEPDIYINEVRIFPSAPPYFSPENHYREDWDNTKANEYFGIDLTYLGDDYTYCEGNLHTITFRNDGKVVNDYMNFSFSDKNSGAMIHVLASKIAFPDECVAMPEKELQATEMKSKYGKVEALFYSYGTNDIFCDVKVNGIYYSISVHDGTPQDAYEAVKCLIQK